ncbi:MAG: Heavy metal transport/detoxification protein [Gammaproteobacteria bacterium]|jgi:copper chaperone CopZ|nr:Heavy metal transport/detoxification protein [Gammaproteobacteria bacterium]
MELTYRIQGVHCTDCIDKIKAALQSIAHVMAITLEPPSVTLHLEKPLPLEVLNAQLAKAGGYQLQPIIDTDTNSSFKTEKTQTNWLKIYYPIFLIAGFITVSVRPTTPRPI